MNDFSPPERLEMSVSIISSSSLLLKSKVISFFLWLKLILIPESN